MVSLISSESAEGGGSASGDEAPPSPGKPSVAGARVLETVRCTSFGVPRVYRRYACDIADDEGNPLVQGVTASPLVPNGGVNESNYNLFLANFFDEYAEFHLACDIADDAGVPLQDGKPIGSNANNAVTKGDYNLFLSKYFDGGSDVELNDEWGQLSFPEHNNRIGYAGYWWDERVNMYCVRHRWYTPRTGRWLTPDPIGYAGMRVGGTCMSSAGVGRGSLWIRWDCVPRARNPERLTTRSRARSRTRRTGPRSMTASTERVRRLSPFGDEGVTAFSGDPIKVITVRTKVGTPSSRLIRPMPRGTRRRRLRPGRRSDTRRLKRSTLRVTRQSPSGSASRPR